MPPRRSTRSASVQPPPITAEVAAPASKRKRGQSSQTVEVAADPPESKPGSRSKRSTPAPAAPKRVSSRKKVLEEVPENDEDEEEVELPPVKKPRSSVEEDEEENEKVTMGKATRARKPAAAPKRAPVSRAGTRAKAAVVKEEEEEETAEGEELMPRTRSSRTSSVKPEPPATPARSSGRSARGSKAQLEEGENENEEPEDSGDDFLESQSKPLKRAPPQTARRSTSSQPPSRRESSARASVAQPPSRSTQKPPSGKENTVPDSDSDLDDFELPTSAQQNANADHPTREHGESDQVNVVPAKVQGKDAEKETPVEEEEQSLLDPPQPAPSFQKPIQVEEPEGPKPRLVIYKLVLVNFKSYAGRQEIGPFHKSFSAIVGPNGSGKSNTIDALLFVFGYRASKMRQGKLSELIHNSARYPDLEECSVEVHFREILDLPGPDAYDTIPNSQLIVNRTAYKNNASRYTINDRQSSYKEVQTLLKGRGIDLDHNRFLILQGEVESIAQMKPKAPSEHEDGLLEYLEDIIGTSRFKEPIEEALVEMDRLNEDRAEKLSRLKIVERERQALEEQKKEAEDYLRLQNDHVRATSRLWQWYIWRCFIIEEELGKKIAQFDQELKSETERNKDDIAHLESLEKHYEERRKVYEEVKVAAAAALKDLQAQEKEQVSLEERRKHAKGKEKKLKKSVQDDEHSRAEAVRAISENQKKMEKEKAKLEELEASQSAEEKVLEQIRDSLKDKTQVFHDQIEEKQKELQPWAAKITGKKTEIDIATSERDTLAKKAETVKAALEEARGTLEQLEADQKAKESELQEVQADKNRSQREMASSGKKLEELRVKVQELRSKASASRQKADDAKSSQQASTSQNKVLDSLNRLKSSGRISGFHGRLGSLGTIPDKYDVAISTACPSLNNLIVDTVEQGQSCIEYLRKQNVGRASFIVLEKLSSNGLDKIATPENVPRLFDLIKPKEPRFAPAFFKAVTNTLVADDLDQANRIAFGSTRRWRVVTLAGQLIDASGTMSGGGTHVARGGMSSKLAADSVSPEVLRQYEQDSERISRELEQALQELRSMEAELENLTRSIPQLDTSTEKLNLDLRNGEKKMTEAQKRVQQLKAQSKPDAADVARISTLEKEIASATGELEKLQKKSDSIESDIKALEKKILEIGGSRLLAQKSKVDGIKLHINLANDEITKAEVAKAKAEKDSVKLSNAVEANKASLEELQGEIATLESDLAECNQYVEQIRFKVEAAQEAAENSKDDLENLKAELDQKTEEIQAFRQKEMALKQQLADTRKEAAENGKALDHWQLEHDKLKLEDIDDDDEEDDAEAANDEAGPSQPVKSEPGTANSTKAKHHSPAELYGYSAEELSRFKKRELIADAELLDEKLKNAKPNLSVLKDYRKREEEFLRRATDLDTVTKLRDEQKHKYDSLTKQRLDEFMTGFSAISLKLKEMYQMITLGGNAELELVDSMDPFSEGIIFSVMPPKKSWRNISNLSGGEKTLSSLALVFALHVYKPTPLYFMDEIDAALDFRNVSIVANYIKDRTKNAQFIIISLRNDMFELSHRLIGIYKTSNATRSIAIDNHSLQSGPLKTIRGSM